MITAARIDKALRDLRARRYGESSSRARYTIDQAILLIDDLLTDLRGTESLAIDLRDRMNRDIVTDVLEERFEEMIKRAKARDR